MASDPSQALSAYLAEAFGPTTVAVLHYGSHAQGRRPSADSAFDFFVVVDQYKAAYTSLKTVVGTSYGPTTATLLANRLPPNVISVTRTTPDEPALRAKCCVISTAHFQRACSERSWDHFCHGRLMQYVQVAWTRDAAAATLIEEALASVRAHTLVWVAPSLPERFTVEEYLATALRRSLAGEIRPETGDHAARLAGAQRDTLWPRYEAQLEQYVAQGRMATDGSGHFRLASAPTRAHRRRIDLYFRKSKMRATLRLFKHVVLYEGWLDYIVRKLERSGNAPVELTARERRWPLIFLWPRFFRFLRTRSQRQQ